MKKTRVYRIPVSWEMYGWLEINASSLKMAIAKANDETTPLPDGHYVEASFLVDEQLIEALFPDEVRKCK